MAGKLVVGAVHTTHKTRKISTLLLLFVLNSSTSNATPTPTPTPTTPQQPPNTHNTDNLVLCNKIWVQGDDACPLASICVPFSPARKNETQHNGFCSCEYIHSGLVDKRGVNSENQPTLRCVTSVVSWLAVVAQSCLAVSGLGVFYKYVVSAIELRSNTCRWDVLSLSAVLLSAATLCYSLTRVRHLVLELALLRNNSTLQDTITVFDAVVSGGLAFFGVGGSLFFAIATLVSLEQAARFAGAQLSTKNSPLKTARRVAVPVGFLSGVGIFVLYVIGQTIAATLVLGVSCGVLFVAFALMTRSLTFAVRNQLQAHSHLIALDIVGVLSTRFRVVLVVLLATLMGIFVSAFVGYGTTNKWLLGPTILFLNIVEFACILLLLITMLCAINSLFKAKELQAQRSRKASLNPTMANFRVQKLSNDTSQTLASPSVPIVVFPNLSANAEPLQL